MLDLRTVALVVFVGAGSLIAQQSPKTAASKLARVSVPFIGCRSDGQAGPRSAPVGNALPLQIPAGLAARLAYYSSEKGLGVLAPRGWFCLGDYGSGGINIVVSPEPTDTSWDRGRAVELFYRYGSTSGRFSVAEVIARVFPAFRVFALRVMSEIGSEQLAMGPFPNDTLTYRSDTVVEYTTPPRTEGLGTLNGILVGLKANDDPIKGVAILVQEPPDLIHLAVRLPGDLAGLTPAIVDQVEGEAKRLPQPKSVQ